MQLTWLDVLAGNIGAVIWLAGCLFSYRMWKVDKTFSAGMVFFVIASIGALIFTLRAGYWAAQIGHPV